MRLGMIALVFIVASLPTLAKAKIDSVTPVLVTDVQRAYDSECTGLIKNDYSVFKRYMAPDYFVITTDDSTKKLDEIIQADRELGKTVRWTKCESIARDLWQSGATTKVVVTNVGQGTLHTKDADVQVETIGTSIDLWTLVDRKPIETSSIVLDSTLIVGGKLAQGSYLPAQGMMSSP